MSSKPWRALARFTRVHHHHHHTPVTVCAGSAHLRQKHTSASKQDDLSSSLADKPNEARDDRSMEFAVDSGFDLLLGLQLLSDILL